MLDGAWMTMQIVACRFLAWGAWLSLGALLSDGSIERHPPDREVAGSSRVRNC